MSASPNVGPSSDHLTVGALLPPATHSQSIESVLTLLRILPGNEAQSITAHVKTILSPDVDQTGERLAVIARAVHDTVKRQIEMDKATSLGNEPQVETRPLGAIELEGLSSLRKTPQSDQYLQNQLLIKRLRKKTSEELLTPLLRNFGIEPAVLSLAEAQPSVKQLQEILAKLPLTCTAPNQEETEGCQLLAAAADSALGQLRTWQGGVGDNKIASYYCLMFFLYESQRHEELIYSLPSFKNELKLYYSLIIADCSSALYSRERPELLQTSKELNIELLSNPAQVRSSSTVDSRLIQFGQQQYSFYPLPSNNRCVAIFLGSKDKNRPALVRKGDVWYKELPALEQSTENCLSFAVMRIPCGSSLTPSRGGEPIYDGRNGVLRRDLVAAGCIDITNCKFSIPAAVCERAHLVAFVLDPKDGDFHVYRCVSGPNGVLLWMELRRQEGIRYVREPGRAVSELIDPSDERGLASCVTGIPNKPERVFCVANSWTEFAGYWIIPPGASFLYKNKNIGISLSVLRDKSFWPSERR